MRCSGCPILIWSLPHSLSLSLFLCLYACLYSSRSIYLLLPFFPISIHVYPYICFCPYLSISLSLFLFLSTHSSLPLSRPPSLPFPSLLFAYLYISLLFYSILFSLFFLSSFLLSLTGSELSMVDVMFAPFLERMAASLPYYKGFIVRGER